MVCWVVQSLIGILGHCHSVEGRKPTSSVGEISIPERDYRSINSLRTTFLPSNFNYTEQETQMFFLSSRTELKKLVLTSRWWRQPSSTETEIRCSDAYTCPKSMELGRGFMSCLSSTVATNTSIRLTFTRLFEDIQSPFTKYEWRFGYMGNHKQLELFDLHDYTSEQPTVIDGKQQQFEKVRQCIQDKQLELDLFPQQSYKTPKKSLRLAA